MIQRPFLCGVGLLAASFLSPTLVQLAAQQPIASGDLLVYRVGDGTAALTSASTASFLDEFTPAGLLVQTIPMPTAASGANQPLTNSGVAVSEGFLNVDGTGRYILCGGYAIAPGTTNIATTASTLVQRVIARIDSLGAFGTVDTTTTLGTAFNGFNIRSVASPDGVQLYASGSGGGIQYAQYGPGTPVTLNTAFPVNTRVANIFDGQLYLSSASGTFLGVGTLGTGLPTTTGQIPSLLNGFPTATGPSNYDFFFADPDTLYVADDRATGAGGIEKWTRTAGLWTLQYTLAVSPLTGCRGVCGQISGGQVTLFATTTANALVSVVDTGAASTFTTLTTGATNTAYRGVRRFVAPSSVTFAGVASPTTIGLPSIGTSGGRPVIGNTGFGIAAGNLGPFGFAFLALGIGQLGPGFPIPGAPATVQIYVTPTATLFLVADPAGNVTQPFALPAVPAYIGTPVAAQVVAIDFNLPDPLGLGSSVGMQLVIGG
jgi:hypothetical protein